MTRNGRKTSHGNDRMGSHARKGKTKKLNGKKNSWNPFDDANTEVFFSGKQHGSNNSKGMNKGNFGSNNKKTDSSERFAAYNDLVLSGEIKSPKRKSSIFSERKMKINPVKKIKIEHNNQTSGKKVKRFKVIDEEPDVFTSTKFNIRRSRSDSVDTTAFTAARHPCPWQTNDDNQMQSFKSLSREIEAIVEYITLNEHERLVRDEIIELMHSEFKDNAFEGDLEVYGSHKSNLAIFCSDIDLRVNITDDQKGVGLRYDQDRDGILHPRNKKKLLNSHLKFVDDSDSENNVISIPIVASQSNKAQMRSRGLDIDDIFAGTNLFSKDDSDEDTNDSEQIELIEEAESDDDLEIGQRKFSHAKTLLEMTKQSATSTSSEDADDDSPIISLLTPLSNDRTLAMSTGMSRRISVSTLNPLYNHLRSNCLFRRSNLNTSNNKNNKFQSPLTNVFSAMHIRRNCRVPIINISTKCNFEVDISVKQGGPDTYSIVHKYSKWLFFKELSSMIKLLLAMHDLNRAFTGGLSSFKVYVLLAKYLETKCNGYKGHNSDFQDSKSFGQERFPESYLGDLLVGFLEWHSNGSNFNESVVHEVDGFEVEYASVVMMKEIRNLFKKTHKRLDRRSGRSELKGSHFADVFHFEDLNQLRSKNKHFAEKILKELAKHS